MPNASETPVKLWLVYIIEATDQSLYTGITNDMPRRWQQHSNGTGAKFFRGRKPASLKFIEHSHTRSSASQREAAIKKLARPAKLRLIEECVLDFDLELLSVATDSEP